MKDRSRKGNSVRHQKKPKTQFFKYPNPYSNDELLRNRAETLSGDKDLRYNQSTKSRKPNIPKHKWEKEEEIIKKEKRNLAKKR